MSNSSVNRGICPAPFFQDTVFTDGGFVEGRLCQSLGGGITCCLPCPLTDFTYPDSFQTMSLAADWISVVSTACCAFLLLSWTFLPVEKTHRHYLSICLTVAVVLMNLGFIIPLAAQPEQCYDAITPHSMQTSQVCAASGAFLIVGGWAGVMWVFLRSLSLHLQICWQVVVGRNFMWLSQAAGWGIPAVGITVALVFSGVSFRFGPTCHINHTNSLADLWIPLLVFAGLTIIIQFATFGYCIKVYLASLADNSASTEGSNLPSYTNSIRTMTPRQAYRRVRRVIQLQWRGIAIVLIIITDVIFFSVIFVFQDNTVESVKTDPSKVTEWVGCLMLNAGDKTKCLDEASKLVVNMPTIGAVLVLLGMNGIWLLFLLGRFSMFTGWADFFGKFVNREKKEFVSADARLDDMKRDTRSYEMLSRDSGKTLDDVVTPSVGTPISPLARAYMASPPASNDLPFHYNGDGKEGRRTPDYFGNTVRYHTPARSFSSPRPPQTVTWDSRETYAQPERYGSPENRDYVNPLGMNQI
ncbi:hypothetical protein QBC33DRAFT_576725 [Phialemonium atrogriseum]|uniref:G-protein coupled receptors family 2 profile 2 domain-containing protein n=1 Tax=Phialemonium atrogriseum TaxID=1093897 RepID=A0AAJ0C8A6_9PEZI|nr:uncharacterized protein QBC33DRAFT_576725 [Phialemonium atrogriseum]KAK1769536.1 hypothetical protein QBC33DRAFT_576725 [Phialemonium atrogriseum]